MSYSTDKFLRNLYEHTLAKETLESCPDNRLASLLAEKRVNFRKLLRIDDWYAMSKPSITRVKSEPLEGHNLVQYDFTFLPGLTVPLWVVEPKNPSGLSMLYCHGHEKYGAKGSFTRYEEKAYHNYVPLRMAEEGYRVVVPELIGFGETVVEGFREEESRGCYANTTNLLTMGYNMAGLRVFEAMSVLDLMKGDWNLDRVCVHGISGGGLVASYLAALDDRPDAVVIAGYTNTFRDTILPLYHCIDNHTPGILSVGECQELIALAVPTPLLITSGKDDPIFPVAGTESAINTIRSIYGRFGHEEKISREIFDGEHEVSFEAMIPFLRKIYAVGE